jgi:hypothetical protein
MHTIAPEAPRSLFREFKHVRQEPGRRRRWFEAPEATLIVWYDFTGVATGFQILLQLEEGERALTWRLGAGFSYSRVDSGDESPFKNLAPILRVDRAIPWAEVEARFLRHAASLETDLLDLVQTRLSVRC